MRRVVVVVVLLAGIASPLAAQAPLGTGFTYQGRLLVNGAPVNASYDFQASLYDSTGALVAGPITRAAVTVVSGLFKLELDFGAAPFAGLQRLLEIDVRPAGSGGYTALLPRQPLDAAPYALASAGLVLPLGIGIGVDGVPGLKVTNGGAWPLGGDPPVGLQGNSNFYGVYGYGNNAGVYGSTVSPTVPSVDYPSAGVIGVGGDYHSGVEAFGTNQYGLYAEATTGTGVYGFSDTGSGIGVWGNTASGTGVKGVSSSGIGVSGTSTTNVGVNAQTGASGTGAVYAYNTGGGPGVWGYSPSGKGVEGQSGTGYGVYGFSSSSYAGYFDGSVYVGGSFVNPSDARLKASVEALPYGLDEILRLAPVSWTALDGRGGERYGVIAQDLEKVLPALVVSECDADAPLAVDYVGLVPVLVNALKEEHAELERRGASLEALERRLAALEEIVRSGR